MKGFLFDPSFDDLMYWEGGDKYHEVKGDAGGATKYGVSLRFIKSLPLEESDINHDGHITAQDIEALDEKTAKGFYRKHFWFHYQLGNVETQKVASKLLNIFVNMRGRTAAKVAQRALISCKVGGIKEDGHLGPISYAAINQITCDCSLTAMYLSALRAHQEAIYRLIAANNPTQNKFLNGWLNRARDIKH